MLIMYVYLHKKLHNVNSLERKMLIFWSVLNITILWHFVVQRKLHTLTPQTFLCSNILKNKQHFQNVFSAWVSVICIV